MKITVKSLSPTYIFTLKLAIINDITNPGPDYFLMIVTMIDQQELLVILNLIMTIHCYPQKWQAKTFLLTAFNLLSVGYHKFVLHFQITKF